MRSLSSLASAFLHKALRLPRVNPFNADDTELGKTIEPGVSARELLPRRKAKTIVVVALPSVLDQWKGELEERFGLVFEVRDRTLPDAHCGGSASGCGAGAAERRFRLDGGPESWLHDFPALAGSVLGWSFWPKGYAGTAGSPIPFELETPLQEVGEVLRPDFAVRERDPRDDGRGGSSWLEAIEPGDDFDRVAGCAGRLEVSAHGRMERLLRQTGASAGVRSNGRTLRLVSAPRDGSSGWLDLRRK